MLWPSQLQDSLQSKCQSVSIAQQSDSALLLSLYPAFQTSEWNWRQLLQDFFFGSTAHWKTATAEWLPTTGNEGVLCVSGRRSMPEDDIFPKAAAFPSGILTLCA